MQGSLKTKEFNFEMYKESDDNLTLKNRKMNFIIVFTKPKRYNKTLLAHPPFVWKLSPKNPPCSH